MTVFFFPTFFLVSFVAGLRLFARSAEFFPSPTSRLLAFVKDCARRVLPRRCVFESRLRPCFSFAAHKLPSSPTFLDFFLTGDLRLFSLMFFRFRRPPLTSLKTSAENMVPRVGRKSRFALPRQLSIRAPPSFCILRGAAGWVPPPPFP